MIILNSLDIDMIFRLLSATILGGFVGLERGFHGKDAGFRTYALVSLGAALIMIVSIQIHDVYKDGTTIVDPSRIAAQVVSGIGFLGAGAIMRFSQGVRGLTTAAGIWATAGIGLACGLGIYKPAIFTTLITLVLLTIFSRLDRALRVSRRSKPAS